MAHLCMDARDRLRRRLEEAEPGLATPHLKSMGVDTNKLLRQYLRRGTTRESILPEERNFGSTSEEGDRYPKGRKTRDDTSDQPLEGLLLLSYECVQD